MIIQAAIEAAKAAIMPVDVEQEKCRTSTGLLEVLSDKFKPQNNETVLSLQYWKLACEQSENAQEWIGYL